MNKLESKFFGYYSSGPCRKRSNWSFDDHSLLGRFHLSKESMLLSSNLQNSLRKLLQIPDDYTVLMVSGSTTGAVNASIWNLLGARPVDVVVQDTFGQRWYEECDMLQLKDVNYIESDANGRVDLNKVNFKKNDVIYCVNCTAAGISNTDYYDHIPMPEEREGLIIADATSALMHMPFPWDKHDVICTGVQKILYSEASLGIIVLSPRAKKHLLEYDVARPIPRILQLKDNNKKIIDILDNSGKIINTSSNMIMMEIYQNAEYFNQIGGMNYMINHVNKNYNIFKQWIEQSDYYTFSIEDELKRSNISVNINLSDIFTDKEKSKKDIMEYLYDKRLALDINSHTTAKDAHLRIWLGVTLPHEELSVLCENLELAAKQILL